MEFHSFLLLLISGLSAGFVTAAAYVAFIAMLGVFPKFAERTNTASNCVLYENCLILGILLATFLQFFASYHNAGIEAHLLPPPAFGKFVLIIFGLFGGIYVGFLIGGLSEVLNVIPIYARITHMGKSIRYIIYFLALGKGTALFIQYLFLSG